MFGGREDGEHSGLGLAETYLRCWAISFWQKTIWLSLALAASRGAMVLVAFIGSVPVICGRSIDDKEAGPLEREQHPYRITQVLPSL